MKKFIAFASAPLLAVAVAACGGDADAPAETNDLDAAANEAIPSTNAGTYTSTADDGSEVTVTLNADGTYTMASGDQSETGTWEDNIRGTCMTATGGAETCYNIQPGADAGMMDITGPDGVTMSYSFEG